jgi:hypothetical protein
MAKFAVPALIALIALLGGFYGGFRFEQTNASASTAAIPGANASPGAGRNANPCSATGGAGRTGANANRTTVVGQVTNVAGNVITIHSPACNTDTKVTLSGNAAIRKTVDGTLADLSNGTDVSIQGTKNSDGTVSANNADILPPGSTSGASPGAGGGGRFPGGGFPGGGGPGGGGPGGGAPGG